MALKVEIENRGTFKPDSIDLLGKKVRSNLSDFFKHCPKVVPGIHLMAFRAGPGGDRDRLVKLTHEHPDHGRSPKGVPVIAYTEGTQGLTALMSIPGMTDAETRDLIEKGPYRHKRRTCDASSAMLQGQADTVVLAFAQPETPPLEEVVQPEGQMVAPSEVEPEPMETQMSPVQVTPPQRPVDIRTPRQKLEEAGFDEEEIKRLQTTLSSIIYREVGDQEMPIQLQVPVTKVTRAIMEHMKLPPNQAGTYRGTVGSFYSAKIALFALKLSSEESFDPDSQYTDWIFDCVLVADFVGGKDQLKALTRAREVEIAERALEEQKPKVPAPTAQEVEAKLLDPFMEDAEVLRLASNMVVGFRQAEGMLAQAEANEQGARDEVARIEELLRIAQGNLQAATLLTDKAREEVARFTLPDDVRKKVFEAKARIDALVKDLGM